MVIGGWRGGGRVEGEGFKRNCVDAVGGNEAWRKMLEKIMCTEYRLGTYSMDTMRGGASTVPLQPCIR